MRHHGPNGRRHRPVQIPRYRSAFRDYETIAEQVERWERDYPPGANGSPPRTSSSTETALPRPALKTIRTKSAAAWNNPDLEVLEDTRGELPDFPNDVLSSEWADFVRRASHAAGVTTAHVAVPLLSISSGIIGCSYRIKAASAWLESCSVWAAMVGYSGTGKTPG